MSIIRTRHIYRLGKRIGRPKVYAINFAFFPILGFLNGIKPRRYKFVIKKTVRTLKQGSITKLYTKDEAYWIPSPVPKIEYKRIKRGYKDFYLNAKYQFEGFAEIKKTDVVVDCGSFVGGFATAVAPLCQKVYCIEPSPKNFKCLKKNIEGFSNIEVYNIGLFNETTKIDFNIAERPYDSSILEPDVGKAVEVISVDVLTIVSFMEKVELDHIDFLKIEAEGVEFEIVKGIPFEKVHTVVVDCNPERAGESPLIDISIELASKGYKVAALDYILYAAKSS